MSREKRNNNEGDSVIMPLGYKRDKEKVAQIRALQSQNLDQESFEALQREGDYAKLLKGVSYQDFQKIDLSKPEFAIAIELKDIFGDHSRLSGQIAQPLIHKLKNDKELFNRLVAQWKKIENVKNKSEADQTRVAEGVNRKLTELLPIDESINNLDQLIALAELLSKKYPTYEEFAASDFTHVRFEENNKGETEATHDTNTFHFASQNVFSPLSGFATMVAKSQGLKPGPRPFYCKNILEETDENAMMARMKANNSTLKSIASSRNQILQEVPNPHKEPGKKFFDILTEGLDPQQIEQMKNSWVTTEDDAKFGLAIIPAKGHSVERITDAKGDKKLENILAAVNGANSSKTGQDGKPLPRAQLCKITNDATGESQYVVNAHTLWGGWKTTVPLIKACVENGVIFAGDTNLQILGKPGKEYPGYDPKASVDDKITQINKLLAKGDLKPDEIDQLEGHKTLLELKKAGKLELVEMGDTLDVVAVKGLTNVQTQAPKMTDAIFEHKLAEGLTQSDWAKAGLFSYSKSKDKPDADAAPAAESGPTPNR